MNDVTLKMPGVKELIKFAKSRNNVITYDDLNAMLPEVVANPEKIDDIFILLAKHKIEVIEDLTETDKEIENSEIEGAFVTLAARNRDGECFV